MFKKSTIIRERSRKNATKKTLRRESIHISCDTTTTKRRRSKELARLFCAPASLRYVFLLFRRRRRLRRRRRAFLWTAVGPHHHHHHRCVTTRKCWRLARGGASRRTTTTRVLDDDDDEEEEGKERARTEEASRVAVRAGDVLGRLWCRTTTRTFFATIEEELFLCETAWKVPTPQSATLRRHGTRRRLRPGERWGRKQGTGTRRGRERRRQKENTNRRRRRRTQITSI